MSSNAALKMFILTILKLFLFVWQWRFFLPLAHETASLGTNVQSLERLPPTSY